MRHYDSPTMKPTQIITNKSAFVALDLGPVKAAKKRRATTTTKRYLDAEGKSRFTGTPKLKKSQNLGF